MPGDSQSSDAGSANTGFSYTVVARRYRPQTFRDLVGQGHIVTALSNAIEQSRVGHAYLFTGARGTGKTSSARIFAKCLNCEQGPTPEPCNECDICLSIAGGEDVDVLEFDGASNRGIDEIRQLRSNINIRPGRSRFKIYIIDEVHMLTKEAFNALLKTLEEPPEHVKFIFCTTDPQKLPITVLSRCQRYDFIPVATGEITDRLREIANREGVEADQAALVLLARRAAGSMRDSQSLLEQVLAYCSGRIEVADVHALLGTADGGRVFELAGAMLGKRPAEALICIQQAIATGCDAGQVANQLVGFVRDLIVSRVGGEPDLLLTVDEADAGRLRDLGGESSLENLLAALQILDQALVRMQSSMHARVILEAAVLRVSQLENLQSLVEQMRQLQLSGTASSGMAPGNPATQRAEAKKKVELDPVRVNPGSFLAPISAAAAIVSPTASSPTADVIAPVDVELHDPVASFPSSLTTPSGNQSIDSAAAETGDRPVDKGRASNGQAGVPGSSQSQSAAAEVSSAGTQLEGESREATAPQPPSGEGPPSQSGGEASGQKNPGWTLPGQGLANPEALWRRTLAELGDFTADLAADFRKVESLDPDSLVVTLSAEYQVQMCNRAERRQRVEDCLARIAGRRIRIDFIAAVLAPASSRPREPVNRRQIIKRLEQHPLVKSLVGLFDGEVVDFELPRGDD